MEFAPFGLVCWASLAERGVGKIDLKMTDILLTHGSYFVITLVLILTGSGLPVPEEVPIIAAGILSANQTLNPFIAFACCLFGALIGDCLMYWIGFHFGRGVLREHPWWARFVTPERESQIEEQFHRHGFKVFFVARFLVGLRSPVYLTAGIMQVSFKRFFVIDLICATSVVGTFFWLTYLFGQYIPQIVHQAEVWLTLAVVIGVAVVGFYGWRRHCRKMHDRLASAEAEHFRAAPDEASEPPLLCRSKPENVAVGRSASRSIME